MGKHHRREDPGAIFRRSERFHRSHLWKRLESIFGYKPPMVFLVVAEWRPPMPDSPVVDVAALVMLAQRFIVCARRTWPIRRFRVKACHNSWQNAAEFRQVILPHLAFHIGRQ